MSGTDPPRLEKTTKSRRRTIAATAIPTIAIVRRLFGVRVGLM
jgi:hypothetical protein